MSDVAVPAAPAATPSPVVYTRPPVPIRQQGKTKPPSFKINLQPRVLLPVTIISTNGSTETSSFAVRDHVAENSNGVPLPIAKRAQIAFPATPPPLVGVDHSQCDVAAIVVQLPTASLLGDLPGGSTPPAALTASPLYPSIVATAARCHGAFTASRILPQLFLGGYSDVVCVVELRRRNIRRVLNVATECMTSAVLQRAVTTKDVRLVDHCDEDIAAHFDTCLAFIREGILAGEGVLVHCRMGVSRSATIVLAYLMTYGVDNQGPMAYSDCFQHVKRFRPEVSPNFGFALQLRELDTKLGFRKSIWDDAPSAEGSGAAGSSIWSTHTTPLTVPAAAGPGLAFPMSPGGAPRPAPVDPSPPVAAATPVSTLSSELSPMSRDSTVEYTSV